MKRIIFLVAICLTAHFSSFGAESEIILINSSAFVVELNDNYDVVKVIEELPNYFSESATHEELLDAYVNTHSNIDDKTIGNLTPKQCRTKSIVEVSTHTQEKSTGFCTQHIDNQEFTSISASNSASLLTNQLFVDPRKITSSNILIVENIKEAYFLSYSTRRINNGFSTSSLDHKPLFQV